ncbi:hypothetical protein CF165_49265 [Amycolatopsis vastitatis]|uniref:Uncharacterized protein n=1 Tax=Amycolatopsis vastitatis TaxID=1905142 RepID=A0A229SJK6_9PSEU|nr:hypothetical protein CF165_49265 [Amycolatopsis vastitatis]
MLACRWGCAEQEGSDVEIDPTAGGNFVLEREKVAMAGEHSIALLTAADARSCAPSHHRRFAV